MLLQHALAACWQFRPDPEDVGVNQGWASQKPQGCVDMPVPSCWNALLPELKHYEGVAWYFLDFFGRNDPAIARWTLFFLGVNERCTVWLNNREAGSHQGGYLPFELDVSGIYQPGATNSLTVRVDNRLDRQSVPPAGVDWFNYGGIFRDVYVQGYGAAWLDDVYVRTRVDGELRLAIRLGGRRGVCRAEIQVCRPEDDGVVAEDSLALSDTDALMVLRIGQPRLWSPEDPYLYRFEVDLYQDDVLQDRWTHAIGIREVVVDRRRILLNGKPVCLLGYSKHEEYPITACVYNEALVRNDYRIARASNANFIRLCHYPHHPDEYRVASEMGFMVMAEVPNVSLRQWHFQNKATVRGILEQAREMLRWYQNETCILFWSLLIECRTDEPGAENLVVELVRIFKERDPDRLVIHASVIPTLDRMFRYFDVVGINYWSGWYYGESIKAAGKYLDEIAAGYPDKPVIMTSGGWEGIYGCHSYGEELKWSEENQADYLRDLLELYRSRPYIIGAIIWTLHDFRVTPRTIDNNARWILRPMETNHKGVLDFYRRPKLAYQRVAEAFREWSGGCTD